MFKIAGLQRSKCRFLHVIIIEYDARANNYYYASIFKLKTAKNKRKLILILRKCYIRMLFLPSPMTGSVALKMERSLCVCHSGYHSGHN